MRLSRFSSSLSAGVLCAFGYLSPQIALAADAAPATPTAEVAAAGDTKTSDAFVSKGAPMAIESLGVVITPPTGWEVSTNTGSLSVVMREPKQTAPDYVNAKYQKNITIAAIHSASPIDEKRAIELEAQLVKAFSADAAVSDFKIMEHKFFNYHGANDDAASGYSAAPVSNFSTMNDAWHLGGHDEVATSAVRQRAKASPKTKPSSQFVSNY